MIRPTAAADEPQIRACAQQGYARYVPLIERDPAPMSADFAAQIAAGDVYVALDDRDGLQGCIVFYAEEDHVFRERVAVFPSMAKQGV